jgi:hypothetical protein
MAAAGVRTGGDVLRVFPPCTRDAAVNNLTVGALDPVAKIPEYKARAVAPEAGDGPESGQR